jgi:hypothetical protein
MPFYRVNPFGQGSPFGIIGEPYTYNIYRQRVIKNIKK